MLSHHFIWVTKDKQLIPGIIEFYIEDWKLYILKFLLLNSHEYVSNNYLIRRGWKEDEIKSLKQIKIKDHGGLYYCPEDSLIYRTIMEQIYFKDSFYELSEVNIIEKENIDNMTEFGLRIIITKLVT